MSDAKHVPLSIHINSFCASVFNDSKRRRIQFMRDTNENMEFRVMLTKRAACRDVGTRSLLFNRRTETNQPRRETN